jgi:hypothetical protein
MVYLKSLLAGFAALFVFIFLVMLCILIILAVLSHRSHGDGAIGWDPIFLMHPGLWWLVLAVAVFGAGFFWEFRRPTR